jgi:transcriptional regulator with XRE-family HTH domain
MLALQGLINEVGKMREEEGTMITFEKYTFSELLKQFRVRASLTQEALAERMGAHRNTISNWEQGNYLPRSRSHVKVLADALNLDEQETTSLLSASLFPREGEGNPFVTEREQVTYQYNQLFILFQKCMALIASVREGAIVNEAWIASRNTVTEQIQTLLEDVSERDHEIKSYKFFQ